RSFRWRDTLGWLWPRIWVSSVTVSSPRAHRTTSLRRVGSATARSAVSNCSIWQVSSRQVLEQHIQISLYVQSTLLTPTIRPPLAQSANFPQLSRLWTTDPSETDR